MNDQPTILFYNSFFGNPPDLSEVPEADRKCFTCDIALFPRADAVVFHIPSLGRIDSLRKPAGQIWVLLSMESSINFPCMADPAFLELFDLTMTYERGADIWMPYFPGRREWEEAVHRPLSLKTESAPAVMFQSSQYDQSGRIAYAKGLMKHMKVDSYGSALNNRMLAVADEWRSTKMATIGRYKFCIAMENSVVDDYVTEKLFDPLVVGTVPVYLGAMNVDTLVPGDHSYVHVRDFSGPKELAEFLNQLDKDDAAYQRFFDWRRKPLRQAFQDDLERRGSDMANLLRAVKARLATTSSTSTAEDRDLSLSFDSHLRGAAVEVR